MSLKNQKSKELWVDQRFKLQPVSKSFNPPVLTKLKQLTIKIDIQPQKQEKDIEKNWVTDKIDNENIRVNYEKRQKIAFKQIKNSTNEESKMLIS